MSPEIQNHLLHLKWLLMLLIALAAPLLALMLGGTGVSLASICLTRRSGRTEPADWVPSLLKRANPSMQRDTLIVLTVIASLLLTKIIYRPSLFSNLEWSVLILMLAAGLGLMLLFRYRLTGDLRYHRLSLAAGGGGVALVLISYFALACTESLLLTPEYWPRLVRLPYLFLSWHGVTRFLEFMLLACVITGTALLFNPASETAPTQETPADRVARNIGITLALGALLLWPPTVCLEMALLPELAGGPLFSALAGLSIALAAAAAIWLISDLLRPGHTRYTFIAVILMLFWCWAFMGHVAREQVLTPAVLAGLTPDTGPAAPATQKAPPAATTTPGRTLGKQLFEQKCTICHDFDRRVVGPPLKTVVPKYRPTPEALQAFLRQPAKRNPDYPSMPNLGLTPQQAEAIAGYLLQQVSP